MELVMTVISWILLSFMAGMRPMWIAISSASIEVTLMVWIYNCLTTEYSDQIWATTVATWDFLMPLSVMTATLLWKVWEEEKVLLRFWIWENKTSSEKERDKWKLILPEKWLTILELRGKKGLRGSKHLWTLLRHLFTSLIGLLRFAYCLTVSLDVATLYKSWFLACWESNSELIA